MFRELQKFLKFQNIVHGIQVISNDKYQGNLLNYVLELRCHDVSNEIDFNINHSATNHSGHCCQN